MTLSFSGPLPLGCDLHKYFLVITSPLGKIRSLEGVNSEKYPSPRWEKFFALKNRFLLWRLFGYISQWLHFSSHYQNHRERFLVFYCDNLLVSWVVKSRKMWGLPKTMVPRSFSLSNCPHAAFSNLLNVPFKSCYQFMAPVASASGKQISSAIL